MTHGDNSARIENLQREGQPQALRAMIQGSANTYASMLNVTLLPFLLYQQSLAIATRVALNGLQAATGVARQGIEAGEETHWQDLEPISQAAQGDVETTGRSSLRHDAEATGETAQESGVEKTEQASPEVDEVASGPPEPVTPPPRAPDAVDELPPSTAPEVLDEPAAEAVDEIDRGSRETNSRADGEGDEAYPSPSAPLPSPAREGSVTAENLPPAQEEEQFPTDEIITEDLPPPPEVPDVDLPPPPPVPSNILDELPPPPTPEVLDEPTSPMRGEKPRVHVRRTTAAARRRAEEMRVDLAEVEGTGQGGRITVDDVRKQTQEGPP